MSSMRRMKVWKACFTERDVIKLNERILETLFKCYSLLEMLFFWAFLESPFLLIASVSQPVIWCSSTLYKQTGLLPSSLHVSEEKIINGKSFKCFETKEWEKYPILITTISRTRKCDCLVANSNQIEMQEKKVVWRGSLRMAMGSLPLLFETTMSAAFICHCCFQETWPFVNEFEGGCRKDWLGNVMHSGWVFLQQSCAIRSRNAIFSWSQGCMCAVGEAVIGIVKTPHCEPHRNFKGQWPHSSVRGRSTRSCGENGESMCMTSSFPYSQAGMKL